MQYALPEKAKNTLSQITLSVNIRKLEVSSGKLLRLNRSIKWIRVIPITAKPRNTSAISIRLLVGGIVDKCIFLEFKILKYSVISGANLMQLFCSLGKILFNKEQNMTFMGFVWLMMCSISHHTLFSNEFYFNNKGNSLSLHCG